MQHKMTLRHVFVESIPDELEDGTIYVSIPYATVAHKCCCGCGHEVVTPLSPTDWTLIFDGRSVSLDPSIGNWSFGCQSHYWIRCNKVIWARRWSQKEIKAGRAYDSLAKERYFAGTETPAAHGQVAGSAGVGEATPKRSPVRKLKMWLFGAKEHSQKGK